MSSPRLASIRLHGVLGEQVGRESWDLAVSSVGEACHAIDVLTGRKFFRQLVENDKAGIGYKVLINSRPFLAARPLRPGDSEAIASSELVAVVPGLETVDIVPVVEGAEDFAAIVLGVVLIAAAFALPGLGVALTPLMKGAMIIGGLGLVAAGVINLISSPPAFADFREIAGGGGRQSYLFQGPVNVIGEGGPVPVLYGRLIVGSQVISSSYVISDRSADQDITS